MTLMGKIYIDLEQQFVHVETHAHFKHTLPMDYIHPRCQQIDFNMFYMR